MHSYYFTIIIIIMAIEQGGGGVRHWDKISLLLNFVSPIESHDNECVY